jgi:excisionase family DNA binding protein
MFYKTKEVAEKLSVTKMTISNMVTRGQLKPINTDKRYFLFDKKQVDCLILKRQSND